MWTVRSWKAGLLLSIIIPMSLLLTFRLTGILHEPLKISETVTLSPVKWETERPYDAFWFNNRVNAYSEGEIQLMPELYIYKFSSNDPFYHSDYVIIYINATMVLKTGFVSTVNFTFSEDYESSDVDLFGGDNKPRFHSLDNNTAFTGYIHYLTPQKGLKAAVEFTGTNQPKNVSIDGEVEWLLHSPANRTSLIQINAEVTYYNGTVVKKIIQPFLLKIYPDNNDTFDTAQEISEGYYPRFLIGPTLAGGDLEDYYKIYMTQGQVVNFNITHGLRLVSPAFNVYVYDPERNLMFENQSAEFVYAQNIVLTANSTGFWFIEIRIYENCGAYSMEVDFL